MSEPDDSALLKEFCTTHNDTAFTSLVRRHLPLVYHAALRRLKLPALAEEAAQNAFARLAAKAASVANHPERLRAWLHRTAYLEACTLARKETRQARVPMPPEPSLHDPMDRSEIYDRLDEQLNALPELDRELLLRHCCGGEEYRRIAAAVGKSEAACQKRVERSLERLAGALGTGGAIGAVITALSAGSSKASALPSADRMAAAALQQNAGSSAAGALSGFAAAACIAATVAGGVTGWRRGESVPSPRPSAAPAEQRLLGGTPAVVPLLPRPVAVARSREDVLEAIQCGRLGPLIEFLPKATVADLRAIIAEDDISGLGEGSGYRRLAHWLALKYWMELDPPRAFAYGVDRDQENTGHSMPVSSMMLAKWMHSDSSAALKAFAALPPGERSILAGEMAREDETVASQLVAAHPEVFWDVESGRKPAPPEDERMVSALLAGDRSVDDARIIDAFCSLARKDLPGTLVKAASIPSDELRAQVLARLHDYQAESDPPASALPAGPVRTAAAAREAIDLMRQKPEVVIERLRSAQPGTERDVLYQIVSNHLAGSDPWRLLSLVVSLKDSLGYAEQALARHVDGLLWDNHLERALVFAGKNDPLRALAMIPDLAARIHARISNRQPVVDMTAKVIEGWFEKDAAAAIRWVANSGSNPLLNEIREYLPKAPGETQTFVSQMGSDNKAERHLAQRVIEFRIAGGLDDGSSAKVLASFEPRKADEIVNHAAVESMARNRFDEALRVAALASVSVRAQEILPNLGRIALNKEPEDGVRWIESLSPADRSAVLNGTSRFRLNPEAAEALRNIKP
ncbi:MAG TPA: sigma-70 family RNA polymerase sigma factor [Verrucomicrobiales bacterium]|nr:sigma-70 family RNA polymerase sigma factor [Verrucomicrobiales bacterium]